MNNNQRHPVLYLQIVNPHCWTSHHQTGLQQHQRWGQFCFQPREAQWSWAPSCWPLQLPDSKVESRRTGDPLSSQRSTQVPVPPVATTKYPLSELASYDVSEWTVYELNFDFMCKHFIWKFKSKQGRKRFTLNLASKLTFTYFAKWMKKLISETNFKTPKITTSEHENFITFCIVLFSSSVRVKIAHGILSCE